MGFSAETLLRTLFNRSAGMPKSIEDTVQQAEECIINMHYLMSDILK